MYKSPVRYEPHRSQLLCPLVSVMKMKLPEYSKYMKNAMNHCWLQPHIFSKEKKESTKTKETKARKKEKQVTDKRPKQVKERKKERKKETK
jgi:hypothetical protein